LGEFFNLGAGVQDIADIKRRREDLAHIGGRVFELRFRDNGSDQPPLSGFGLLPEQARIRHPFRVVVATNN